MYGHEIELRNKRSYGVANANWSAMRVVTGGQKLLLCHVQRTDTHSQTRWPL